MVRQKKKSVNLIQKTYDEMHSSRNDFLHGNILSENNLHPEKNPDNPSLTICAVFIFKCALMVCLGMFNEEDYVIDYNNLDKRIMEIWRVRSDFESALKKMRNSTEC